MEQVDAIQVHGGATVDGVRTDTEVIMARKGFDKWPSIHEGLNQWEAKVQFMDLHDVKLPIGDIAMSLTTGGLYNVNKDSTHALPATRTAIGHLMSYVKDKPANALGCMLDLPLALRSRVFATYLQRGESRNVILRTAIAPMGDNGSSSDRVVRAVVSESHSREHGDDLQVIASLRAALRDEKGMMRVVRQWDSTLAEIVIPNLAVQPKVGVVLYGRLAIENSETKGSSYTTEGGSMNLICWNGAVRAGDTSEYRVRHMGNIGFRVSQSIKGALDAIGEHLQVFSDAYQTELARPRADVIAAFVKVNELPESTGGAIATLWDVDGERGAGDTLAGLVNAVTRHAQSLPVGPAIIMESIAGQTLHRGLAGLV